MVYYLRGRSAVTLLAPPATTTLGVKDGASGTPRFPHPRSSFSGPRKDVFASHRPALKQAFPRCTAPVAPIAGCDGYGHPKAHIMVSLYRAPPHNGRDSIASATRRRATHWILKTYPLGPLKESNGAIPTPSLHADEAVFLHPQVYGDRPSGSAYRLGTTHAPIGGGRSTSYAVCSREMRGHRQPSPSLAALGAGKGSWGAGERVAKGWRGGVRLGREARALEVV